MRTFPSVGRWPFLGLLLSVLALLFLSTLPYWTFREIEVLRQEADHAIDPAQEIVGRLEVAAARQARGETTHLYHALTGIAPRLNPATRAGIAAMDSLVSSGSLEELSVVSAALHRQLRATSVANRGDLLRAQRRGIAWSGALFIIALVMMLAVGWTVWNQRLLVEQIGWARAQGHRLALDEEALRAAAAAVAAPLTTSEVVRQIATGALKVSNADGAYAARLEPDKRMRVIATAGECALAIDASVEYEGTAVERIIDSRLPGILYDEEADKDSQFTIILPMIEGEAPIGVLTLVYRDACDDASLPILLARANTFSDLAAIALQKARMLEESEDRRLKLEAVEASRSRLLRGFSHDIRNPLSNTDGYLQLLERGLRGPVLPEQVESLRRARSSLGTGIRLLRDLLDFTLASVGHIPLTIRPVSVPSMLTEVMEDHRAEADAKRIALTLIMPKTMPDARTRLDRLRQVLDNLVSNAVKYTRENGKITIAAVCLDAHEHGASGPWVRIDVIDNGIGIPPEQHDAVFQEFTRLTRPMDKPGLGIGLAISQWLAHALGGRITLTSEVAKGSTFSLWLPLGTSLGALPETGKTKWIEDWSGVSEPVGRAG